MIYDDAPPPIDSCRPPLGVMPKWLWIEQMNNERIDQLKAAIQRGIDANFPIPIEWIEELNELIAK